MSLSKSSLRFFQLVVVVFVGLFCGLHASGQPSYDLVEIPVEADLGGGVVNDKGQVFLDDHSTTPPTIAFYLPFADYGLEAGMHRTELPPDIAVVRLLGVTDSGEVFGADTANRVRDLSLSIYTQAHAYARERGIIIADTKFEFGHMDGELILIDEVLTPDSSRFWPADQYEPGRSQPSFDKQFVRDYLETLDWDKTPPGPELPDEVVNKTSEKYLEAYERLTGGKL